MVNLRMQTLIQMCTWNWNLSQIQMPPSILIKGTKAKQKALIPRVTLSLRIHTLGNFQCLPYGKDGLKSSHLLLI